MMLTKPAYRWPLTVPYGLPMASSTYPSPLKSYGLAGIVTADDADDASPRTLSPLSGVTAATANPPILTRCCKEKPPAEAALFAQVSWRRRELLRGLPVPAQARSLRVTEQPPPRPR